MAHVIDGVALARELRASIEEELEILRLSAVQPGLATLRVGTDYAAQAYESHLRRLAEGLGYRFVAEHLTDRAERADVLATIGKLNADPRVTGILVLRPLPPQLAENEVNAAVDPFKDVEAVNPINAGLLASGRPRFVPSTPASCFFALDSHVRARGEDPRTFCSGRTLVVLGRSQSVGKPAQWLGLHRDATVIACHSRTRNLAEFTQQADVLIVSTGVPALVRADMVREGVIAIDVGINAVQDAASGKVVVTGDIDFDGVAAKAEAITPVPGGIGPITDVWLVGNVLAAAAMAARVEPRFGGLR